MTLYNADGTPRQDPYELTMIQGQPTLEAITRNQLALREFVRMVSTNIVKSLEELTKRLENIEKELAGLRPPS